MVSQDQAHSESASIRPGGKLNAALPSAGLGARLLAFFNERYRSADPRWLGLFRICFGCLLITELLYRWSYARLLFSNDGVLPNHYALFAPMGQDSFSVYHAFSTLGEVHVAFALTFAVFACFTVGYRTRLFHVLSAVLITSLHSRNLFVENGGSVVTHSLATWTVFLPLGRCFSVDAVRRSLADEDEHTAEQLNRRSVPKLEPFVSIVVGALLLQWSVIYFFNCVHKSGEGWRNGSAIYWFLHQDRIVTWVGVWVRDHVPFAVLALLTRATLVVEGMLALVLLVPFGYRWLRRCAFLLALALHGNIALLSRLGPFSYVMVLFFLMWFGQDEFALLGRWFGRPARAVTLIFDADCGICLWTCRLLKRLDPWQRLTFVGNDETSRLPVGLDPKLCETSIVVVDARGHLLFEERAVRRLLRSLPLGWLAAGWLYLPGLSFLARCAYRWVASHRLQISQFFGLGACGVAPARKPPVAKPRAASGRLIREFRDSLVVAREALVILLMVVLSTEVLRANPYLSRHVRLPRPHWMAEFIGYTRMLEGWGMFAPEPPYEDGRLVVDGRTVDGLKFDPFTGEPPEFDPGSPKGWGHDQLWCDYSNHIRWNHNEGRRQFLRDYLVHRHIYTRRPREQLKSFDVWWIQDRSPPPGQKRGLVLPPQKLISYGVVTDSGALPWLVGKAAGAPPGDGGPLP